MPKYMFEIGGKTYDIESDRQLSDQELASYARQISGEKAGSMATPGQIPGAGPYVAPPAAQPSGIPIGRRAIQMARPTVEALGTVGGAALGTAGAPGLGTLLGAGAGYSAAKGGLDALEEALGYKQPPASVSEALAQRGKEVLTGATMEAAGRGVLAPALTKGAEYAGKVKNIKLETYLTALEGKGDDILNALRGPRSAVAGAAPGAGEVAAPAGSARFSALQAKSERVPAVSSEFAFMRAQTGAAEAAQQTRAQAKFDKAAAKVQQKIDTALQPVRSEEAGATLAAGAQAKRQSMKADVIRPAYEKAFNEAGDAKIDMSGVVGKAEEILGRKLSQFDPSTAPETIRKLLELQKKATESPVETIGKAKFRVARKPGAAPEAPAITLRDLDDIRKAINADIASGKVSSDPTAAMRLRNLGQIHKVIDDAVERSAIPDAAKQSYRQALDLYRTQYIPRFKTGVNEQLFRQTGLNEPKIKPEDVITKYFQPRGVSEAKNFVTLFGKDPQAMKTARAGIEDVYLREVPNPTPEAHAAFLRKYADPIKVLDDAGMNVLQRINVVGQNAARLQKINDLAAQMNVKLAPSLPPGATADAVEKRLQMLTGKLTSQQKAHVNAVQQDLIRRQEYERLVKAGLDAGIDIKQIGTKTGQELGLPLPNFLSVPITIFNATAKRLALKLDDKLALEIAREMTDPALAAKSVEQALRLQTSRAAGAAVPVAPTAGRAAAIGAGIEIAPRAEPGQRNTLAPQPINALTR
jgi:hypothetical protein